MDNSELAAEVAASLTIGNEMSLDRQVLRSLAGFAGLLAGAALRKSVPAAPAGNAVWMVSASPVAHGAALASAAWDALSGLKVELVADARHAAKDLAVTSSFPGLAPASMVSASSWARLARAVRLRMTLPATGLRAVPVAPLYREYLFLAQAMRYQAAEASLPGAALVLTDFDRDNYCRPLVWAAKRLGIPTMTLVHGTPNEANYVPVLADWVGVWGTAQAEWFARHSPAASSAVIGRLEADECQPWSGPLKRVILCHSMEVLSATEVQALTRLVSELQDREVACELRLHPKVRQQRGLGSWEPVAELTDKTELAQGDFFAQLKPGDGVVAVTSSAVIQACVGGYPVAVVADPERVLPADVAVVAEQPGILLGLAAGGRQDAGAEASMDAVRTTLVAATGHRSRAALREAVEGILGGRTASTIPTHPIDARRGKA